MPNFVRALVSLFVVIGLTISASANHGASTPGSELISGIEASVHTHELLQSGACASDAIECDEGHPDGHVSSSCCAGSCHLGITGHEAAIAVFFAIRIAHSLSNAAVLLDPGVGGLLRPPRSSGALLG